MLDLLLADLRLAIDLAHAAIGLAPTEHYDIRARPNNLALRRLFEGEEMHELYPDLVISVHDEHGDIVELWIIENQLKHNERKRYLIPAYCAGAQLALSHDADALVVSPVRSVRRSMFAMAASMRDGPAVLGLYDVIRVCNPDALWLVDDRLVAPPVCKEQLSIELEIAQQRPTAALFHAVHHARDMRACQVVLAALLAARELGPEYFRRYTSMIMNTASRPMNEYLRRELSLRQPREELSEWEREGAGFLNGLDEGLERGRAEGLERGRAEGLERALLDILELRGLPVDAVTRARIAACHDLDQLERWYARSKQAPSVADVFD